MERYELNYMPYDKVFTTETGQEELCHATGFAVIDENGHEWNEYIDSEGNYQYGL